MARVMRRLVMALWCLAACNLDTSGLGKEAGDDGGEQTSSSTAAEPPTGGSSSDSGVMTGSASSGGTTTEVVDGTATVGEESTTGEPLACGMSLPPEDVECDPACTGGCANDVCRIDCVDLAPPCYQTTITCPEGQPCFLECGGTDACKESIIECPSGHACAVECSGVHACEEVELHCGTGTCSLRCLTGNGPCNSLDFHCGANDGFVECSTEHDGGPVAIPPEDDTQCSCSVDEDCDGS